MCGALSNLGKKSRGGNGVGLNVGQLKLLEQQLCNPEMETALVTSGNDTPSATLLQGSPGTGSALDWDRAELALFPPSLPPLGSWGSCHDP